MVYEKVPKMRHYNLVNPVSLRMVVSASSCQSVALPGPARQHRDG